MKNRLLIFPFLLLLCNSFLQGDSVHVIKTAHYQAQKIFTDNLGNFYLLNGNQLDRLNSTGAAVRSFSDKNFGSISGVDVTNPLRILIFYKDFMRVSFLDNTMSLSGDPVRLDELGYPLATLACTSHDNGFWIYDQQSFGLVRFDRDLKISQQTGNLSQLLGTELHPDFLVQANNRVLLHDTARGILLFDVFGTYSKTIAARKAHSIQSDGENIYYVNDNWFHRIQIRQLSHDSLQLPSSPRSAAFFKNQFYLLADSTYSIAEKSSE